MTDEAMLDRDCMLDNAKTGVSHNASELHPEDAVTYYRDVATYATEQAGKQEETNDREGVPER